MKVTIKPKKYAITGTKEVFHDGVLYATYYFHRARSIINNGRGRMLHIRCAGSVTYVDGRVTDISYYSWSADVERDFRNGSL